MKAKATNKYYKNSTTGQLIQMQTFDTTIHNFGPSYFNGNGTKIETPTFKGFIEIGKKKFAIEQRKLKQNQEECGYTRACYEPNIIDTYLTKTIDGEYKICFWDGSEWDSKDTIIAWRDFPKTDIEMLF